MGPKIKGTLKPMLQQLFAEIQNEMNLRPSVSPVSRIPLCTSDYPSSDVSRGAESGTGKGNRVKSQCPAL